MFNFISKRTISNLRSEVSNALVYFFTIVSEDAKAGGGGDPLVLLANCGPGQRRLASSFARPTPTSPENKRGFISGQFRKRRERFLFNYLLLVLLITSYVLILF